MSESRPRLTRREVLAAGAVTAAGAVGVAALAGCGSSSAGTTRADADGSSPPPPGSEPASSEPAASPATSSPAATGGGGGLISLADVPVGGCASADGPHGPALVSQPIAGTVVAFSARCTHMACTVGPAGKEFQCPCHGSVFDAFTGRVIRGPAPAALPPIPVAVRDGEVVATG